MGQLFQMARVKSRSWFYSWMGIVALFAIAVGFGRTYAAPMMLGTFAGPRILHIHGAFALAWVLLFVAQPLLIRWHALHIHRRFGYLGIPLALGVAVTMIPAGLHQVTRDVAAGVGPSAISSLLGVITSALMFVALVVAGVIARRDREAHPRWMLLATLLVIWPAWFRFRHWFPQVPRPDIWFGFVLAMAWVAVAMARDLVARGAVHPVLLFAGSALIAEQSLEVMTFDSPWWQATAAVLYDWLQ